MTPTLGLTVLGCLAAVFTVGVLIGRTAGTQRHIDRLLEHELRRPQRRPRHAARPAVYVADGSKLGIATENAMAGARAFSEALRADPLPRIPTRLVEQAAANGRCAMPVTTSMGPAVCLMHPGHAGGCQ